MNETLQPGPNSIIIEPTANPREPELVPNKSNRHVVFDSRSSGRYPLMRLTLAAIPLVASTLLLANAPDPNREAELARQQAVKDERAAARKQERESQEALKQQKAAAAKPKRETAEEFRQDASTGSGKSKASGKSEGTKRVERRGNK